VPGPIVVEEQPALRFGLVDRRPPQVAHIKFLQMFDVVEHIRKVDKLGLFRVSAHVRRRHDEHVLSAAESVGYLGLTGAQRSAVEHVDLHGAVAQFRDCGGKGLAGNSRRADFHVHMAESEFDGLRLSHAG
jgi:hypothetical protein